MRGLIRTTGVLFVLVVLINTAVAEEPSLRRTERTPGQLEREIIGKDGAPMILIPAGEFVMGENHFLTGRFGDIVRGLFHIGDTRDSGPKHVVYVDAFYMDKYELTTSRYANFLAVTGKKRPAHWNEVNFGSHGNRPVIGVDWNDADGYCGWFGKRLPSEAEWEKAARGTDERNYPWGDDPVTTSLARYDWNHNRNWEGYETVSPVGSYDGGNSPYGIHDLAGNVWEWVMDWYNKDYYKYSPANNPKGPQSGPGKVFRGGSWGDPRNNLRSSLRVWSEPSKPSDYIGFRCVQDVG